jgi:hypothetical protein
MSDQEVEVERPVDAGVALATGMIVLTTVLLVTATFITLKVLGDRYKEGMLKSN